MKKAAATLLLCFILFSAYAVTYDVSLGHREAVVFNTIVFPQVSVSSDHLRGDLRILGTDQADFVFTYISEGRRFGFETGFHNQITGFEAISFSPFADGTFTHKFGFMTLRLELGVQLSVLRTKYIRQHMFAVMPVFSVEMTFSAGSFELKLYVDDHNINDMSWRNYPVFGARASVRCSQAVTVYADVWARATEYLVDKWLMISSEGFRAGVRIEK